MRKTLKILAIVLMLSAALGVAMPSLAQAAIAFDAVSGVDTTSSTITVNHTVTGTNPVLLCGMYINSSGTVSSMTYNGTNMTLVDSITNGSDLEAMYILYNPSTGTHAATLMTSVSGNNELRCVSYTGAQQAAPLDAHDNSKASCSTDCTDTLTSTTDNAWHVIISRSTTGNLTAGTGDVIRDSAGQNGDEFLDSNAAITPAGSHTAHWSQASGPGINYRVGMILAPFTAAVAAKRKDGGMIFFQ